MSLPAAFIGAEELVPVLSYIESCRSIKEILVSGGDPLTADDGALEELFRKLRGSRSDIIIRLCSRVPITNPARIKAETIDLFVRFLPLKIVTHVNHPAELAQASCSVLTAAVEAGIPVLVQTVLLRGINDNAEVLAELFQKCLNLGFSPYYLFQLDPAPGTAHFRVPLKEGLSIYRELKNRAGALNSTEKPLRYCPVYAVDLSGGGGKIASCGSIRRNEPTKIMREPVDKYMINFAL